MDRTRFIHDTHVPVNDDALRIKRGIASFLRAIVAILARTSGDRVRRGMRGKQCKRAVHLRQRKDGRLYLAVCRLVVHRVKRREHIAR